MDQVLLFSRKGRCLADIRVTAERTWTANDEGEAEFDLATSDPACREDWINYGNWVLIRNDKLPSWVGMIDTPREWKRRFVHVHAFSPDRQLAYRDVPRNKKWS